MSDATPDPDDAQLLRRFAEHRSEQAFATLVHRYVNLVFSAALRQVGGDAHLAEEVTQNVFTRLAHKAASLTTHPVLSGWLHQTTRFAAIDALRAKLRRAKYENEAASMNTLSTEDPGGTDWTDVRPIVDALLAQLSERDRHAVLLRFFEGRSFSEVAAKLKVTEDAARMRVSRALDQVRALLARRGIKSSAAALAAALTSHAVAAAPAGLAATVTGAALTSVAAVGGGAAGTFVLLKFMSTTKLVTGVAAAITLVAVGTAVYESKESREATATAETLRVERDGLRTQLASLEKRATQSDQDLAAQQKEVAALRASASAPKPADVAPTRAPATQYGSTMDYILQHPETQPAFLEQQRLRMKARFSRFFQTAGLTAEQQEKFLKETLEVAAAELDLMAAMRTQGWGVGNLPKDPEAQKQFQALLADQKKIKETSANNIRAALGDALYQQLQQFGSMAAERNVAEQVASQVFATDAPLTSQQADELARILAQNRFTPQPTATPTSTIGGVFISPQMFSGRMGQAMQQGGMSLLDWSAPITDAALARAAAVLPPAQLAALREIQAQQSLQFQLAPLPPGATNNNNTQPAPANSNGGG